VSIEPDNFSEGEDVEIVDGFPVISDPAPVPEPLRPVQVPAVQAAALAATGFVAGAATVAVVVRRRARPSRRRRKKGKNADRKSVV